MNVTKNVSVGQTVLVQLDAESYGLYRATQAFSGNIANKDMYQGSGWERLTDQGGTRADHGTDSGPVDLIAGDVVLDKFNVQSLTLQLFKDIDIKAQDEQAVNLAANAGGQVIIQTSDNLKLHHVLAGGDVRLQANSASTAYPGDMTLGGSITGDGTVAGDTADPATDIAIGTRGDLILLADGSIGTDLDPLRIQVAPIGSLSANASGQLYLRQISGTTLNIDYIDTAPDTTAFNPADRRFSVTPAEVAQFGYVNSLTSMHLPELIKIDADTVDIDDLTVENASAGGDLSIRILDETGPSDTGNLIIGRVQAGSTVDLRAPESILDLFDDAPAPVVNILTDDMSDPGDVYLEAGGDIGSVRNFLEVEIRVGDLTSLSGRDTFIRSSGDLRVTSTTATSGDAVLRVTGDAYIDTLSAAYGTAGVDADLSIIDRRNDGQSNINAASVVLNAEDGTIGAAANPFEMNSSHLLSGTATAEADGEIFLVETAGDIQVNTIVSETDDVTLHSDGSIVDGNLSFLLGITGLTIAEFRIAPPTPSDLNISGVNINLVSTNGSIGSGSDAIEIDSSKPAKGWVNAAAPDDIYLTEVAAELNVGQAVSSTGDIGLNVRDSSSTGEDLLMDENALISATGGSIFLHAGDDAVFDAGSEVISGVRIILHGDAGDTGNNDSEGTLIDISGTLDSVSIEIAGERQDDYIILHPESLSGHTDILGDTDGLAGGQDTIILDQLPSIVTVHDLPDDAFGYPVRDTVDVDGRGGLDTYIVNLSGELTDYRVNVLDTGAAGDGADTLTINGTAEADILLLRRSTSSPATQRMNRLLWPWSKAASTRCWQTQRRGLKNWSG